MVHSSRIRRPDRVRPCAENDRPHGALDSATITGKDAWRGRRRFWLQGAVLAGLVLVTGLALITGAQAHPRKTVRGAAVTAHPRPVAQLRGTNAFKARAAQTLASLRARHPVRGPITSDFGTRRGFWRTRLHRGVDIGARQGTPVRAPAAGTITVAGWRGGYGRTIMIDHGHGLQTRYGHLSKGAVRPGQKVERGAIVGLTGASGNASGPHLHYEVLMKGRPVNPRDSISRSGELRRNSSSPGRSRR